MTIAAPGFIPYGRQSIGGRDLQAVLDVLKSDWLTQGPAIERFEEAVAEYCGARYAVAANSATSALHLACLAVGFGEEDTLWTSPNTFVASANCGLYCGGKVDFVDIDAVTYNMDAEKLEQKLISAQREGECPRIVIPVHFAGQSCAMERIRQLSNKYGFVVIEDASHAIGGTYQGTRIGRCSYSDMTVFSFHPVKIITTGEGGMVLTNRRDLYEKLILYRSHGITRNPSLMEGESQGPWYYQQIALGFNYRITDIQAALGFSQLQRLNEFVARRQSLAERYQTALEGLPLTLPRQQAEARSAWHLFVLRLHLLEIENTRREIFEEFRRRNIGVNVHYIPVHSQPYYRRLGFNWGDFPEAEKYYEEAITLPLFYELTEQEQDYVIQTVRETVR